MAANPKEPRAALQLAELDVAASRLDEARKTLANLLAGDAGNHAARLMMADIEERRGNSAAAIEQYRKVLDGDGKNLPALNNLAFLLANNAQPDEALKYAQQARELAPTDMTVADTLGWAYYRKGFYPAAVQHLEAAVAKEPSARRKYHLAMAYLKNGERGRGAAVLDQALRMDPGLSEAKMAQQILQETAASGALR
jgi:tetratricopeptide (TPR) repeat protein